MSEVDPLPGTEWEEVRNPVTEEPPALHAGCRRGTVHPGGEWPLTCYAQREDRVPATLSQIF
eukprot:1621802-Rhodomonas_salina.1